VTVLIVEREARVFTPARRCLYIDQISVEPEWEGQGVGTRLMEAAIEYAHAAKIDELEVDTFAFNEKAQRFFTSFGFQPKIQRFWMQVKQK
jgi:GNAT superfamily N-acetyltransferase